MKNTLKILVPLGLLVLSACGDTEGVMLEDDTIVDSINETEDYDYSDMTMYDFTKDKIDLPFKMMLPLKTTAKPMIGHTEDVIWTIKLDDKFSITIDDWGTEVQTIESIKDRARSNIFNIIPETEDEDEITYFYELKADSAKPENERMRISHFSLIKIIDGTYYTISSNDFGTFSLSRVKNMMRAAKSFQIATEEV
jgi:hypothetical protein